jgi:hypothetical protein
MVIVVISNKKHTSPSPEDDFDRAAKSIFLNILAVNPWLQRFYPAAIRSNSRNSHKAKNLTERYPYFRGLNLMPLNPNVKICTHVKVTGLRCGSPALREEKFCYFHQRMIRGVPTPKSARIHPIALIENEEAIQVALMETINAIVRNTIDMQRANLILRALNIAVRNSRRVRFDRCESEMIRKLPELQPDEAILSAPAMQAAAPSSSPSQDLNEDERETPKPAAEAPSAKMLAARKPPGRVTSAAIAQAQAANARPLRE